MASAPNSHIVVFLHDGNLIDYSLHTNNYAAHSYGNQAIPHVAKEYKLDYDQVTYEVYKFPGHVTRPTGRQMNNDQFLRLTCGIGSIIPYTKIDYYPRFYKHIKNEYDQ
jgi:hypothetical protein